MKNLDNRVPPILITLACSIIMWEIAKFNFLKVTWFTYFGYYSSVFIIACSVLMLVLASWSFYRRKTSFNPLSPGKASTLVTTGVYKISRNPMYLGFLLLLISWWIFLGELLAVCGCIFFVIYMNKFQIAPEERILEKLFGGEYLNYKSKVRRWI